LLVKHFLKKYREADSPAAIEPEVIEILKRYPWHGNVRELASAVQNMMLFCKGNTITVGDLPPHILNGDDREEPLKKGKIALGEMVGDLERKFIVQKLKESNWNREKAALLLGITRKKLISRMAKYRIKAPKDKLND
jgi:DNA-binding NtrC family response regulator